MRNRFLLLALLLSAALSCSASLAADSASPPAVRINEFLADNDNVIADEWGEFDDVLELYNAGPDPVDLGGMYLTDDLEDPTKFPITDTMTIPAGGFVIFWADDSPAQGIYHTNFKLSKSGESIGLFDSNANGNALVDSYRFMAQTTNVSEGRCPDGGPSWLFFKAPTIGATNGLCGKPPSIVGTHQTPAFPQASEAVTVTATLTDDGVIVAATLWYNIGGGYQAAPMHESGGDQYQATIPGQPQDTWVQYYLEAKDDAGWKSTDPPGAPPAAHSYVSGYEAPPLKLNELMADNQTTLVDPDEPGEYPDWFELYNAGDTTLDLRGLYLTDDLADPTKFHVTDTITIPAHGFLVLYADGEPEQGPLHTNFKLSAGGEAVGLYGADGKVRLDTVRFPAQAADTSYGRLPDGTGDWSSRTEGTPGRSNRALQQQFLPLMLRAPETAPLPLRLDCGSDLPYITRDGTTTYLADRAWSWKSYGYVGGSQYLPSGGWETHPVGGSADDDHYKTQRIGWKEYRVSEIPNGPYLLTLRFEEQILHGPGLSVFDVTVEGQRVLDDFDIWAQVGRYYALNRRFAVTVADGELNVAAVPTQGETRLSALELTPREPDSAAPAVPTGLAATSSYHAILLDWIDNKEDDLAGYHVYRAAHPQGLYTRLTVGEPAYSSRYQDNLAAAHVAAYYRVTAVDVYGNESDQSSYVSGAAITWADATLPLYQLEVSSNNLATLYADPLSDRRVPGTFSSAGEVSPASVRFRGNVGRYSPKKSWKIVFPADSPFPNQDRINVNAFWWDPTLVHSKLAASVSEAAGIRPPANEHVLLALNGEYLGLYTRVEQMDEAFLERTGRNPGASIYKVVCGFARILPNEAAYRRCYEKETNTNTGYDDLIGFVELINNTPDDRFAAALASVMDVEAFLDYYAVIVLTADRDSAAHNIYLVHDLETDRWELVPWDTEITFISVTTPIDMGTEEHPVHLGAWNMLWTRVLRVPEFRAYYCKRLEEYMNTIFADAVLHPKVDAVYTAIEQDGLRDWRKLYWEGNQTFMAAPSWIKNFITKRKEFLRGEMATYCSQG